MKFITAGPRYAKVQKAAIDRTLHHGNGFDSTVYAARHTLAGVSLYFQISIILLSRVIII